MVGTITAVGAGAVRWLQIGGAAANNSFPWSLVAILLGGGGTLAVGGYLVARFLTKRREEELQNK
jgi:hypothetical protein